MVSYYSLEIYNKKIYFLLKLKINLKKYKKSTTHARL
jgi:hypothetical protein